MRGEASDQPGALPLVASVSQTCRPPVVADPHKPTLRALCGSRFADRVGPGGRLTRMWGTRPPATDVEAQPELALETDFRPIAIDRTGNLRQEHCSRRVVVHADRAIEDRTGCASEWTDVGESGLLGNQSRGAEWRSGPWCSIWMG